MAVTWEKIAYTTDIAEHAGLITGVHGLVFTAGKTLTLTESLTFNAAGAGALRVAAAANTIGDLAVGLTTQVLVGGGAATVPAWSTDLPTALTIGTKYIYRADGTDIPVADGGTGASTLTDGGLLVGAGVGAIEALAVGLTTQILVGGGAGTNPAWGTDLPTAVTIGTKYVYRAEGTDVTVADGGTGVSTLADGGLVIGNAGNAVEVVVAGLTTQILVGGGALTAPAWGTNIPTAVTIGTKYIYRADGTDVAVADGGTNISSYAVGDILYASGATALSKLADVAVGSYLRSGGITTAPVWSTLKLPNAATAYRLAVATSANTIGELAAVGATGEYLKGNTGAVPSWATLNQAAVAGLTTADGPSFAHVHLTDAPATGGALITAAESWIGPSSTTGIYFKTGNVGVGIGTASPLSKFHVQGSSNSDILSISDGTIRYRLGTDASNNLYLDSASSSNRPFTIKNSGAGDAGLIVESGNVGIGTTAPVSIVEAQGGLTTVGAVLTLGTKEPSVVVNDVLGRINFYAPLEADGGDAILVGASILALAEDTFSATVNKTSLVFKTGASETATTKMTLSSAGVANIPIGPLSVGVDDTTVGSLYLYGGGAGADGGVMRLYLGADDDGGAIAAQYYGIQVIEDDLCFGPDGDTDALKLDANKDFYITDGMVSIAHAVGDETAYGTYSLVSAAGTLTDDRSHRGVWNEITSSVDRDGNTYGINGCVNKATLSSGGVATSVSGIYGSATIASGATADVVYGLHCYGLSQTENNISKLYSQLLSSFHSGSATIADLAGIHNTVAVSGAGTAALTYGNYTLVEAYFDADAEIVTGYGYHAKLLQANGATFTTGYLFYGEYSGTVGTKYGVYITGETLNYFSGNLRVDGGGFYLSELAAAQADIAGKGQFWVKNDTPNVPMFTDDAGTDHQLAYA